MRFRFTLSALLAAMAALLVAFASPALAKGGGGGGGGTTTVPVAGCAQIVGAVVNPNPAPANVHPLPGQAYVADLGVPSGGPVVAFDLTVNNQCIDEGGGARSSLSVATTVFDTATGAQLFTGVNMQPAGMLMTWRSWTFIPTADTTAPARTMVVSLTRANGQVQDTLTYTAAEVNQAILTAVATQTPQSIGH
jgi:hypothetical protein